MQTIAAYVGAALAEIGGCFAFWAWLRLSKAALWVAPGMFSLAQFAYLLTLVDALAAGRAYAAYGGVYIVASLAWFWVVEGVRPDRWDLLIGFGRDGSAIGEALDGAGGDHLVIEAADARFVALRERGVEAFVGNAAKPSMLSLANLPEAKVLVIAIPDAFEAGQIAEQARRANPSITILARAHSDPDAEHLVAHGADIVVLAEREIARGIRDQLGLPGPNTTQSAPAGD